MKSPVAALFGTRVPFVPQMEVTECGAACLAMVLGSFGVHVPLGELRVACRVSRDGVSALDIANAAKAYGLEVKAFKTGPQKLAELPTPAILHWELNHWVVLVRLERDGASILDPAAGRRRISHAELSRAFTGVVLVTKPGPACRKRPRSARGFVRYRSAVLGAASRAKVLLVSAVLLEVIAVLQPAAARVVVDFVLRPLDERWLVPISVVFVASCLVRGLLLFARDRIVLRIGAQADVTATMEFLRHLYALPTTFFAQRTVGEIVSRVHLLVGIGTSLTGIFLGAFDVVVLVLYHALLVTFEPRLGILVSALTFGRMIVAFVAFDRVRDATADAHVAAARTKIALVLAFSDPESHKAFGTEQKLLGGFTAAKTRELNARARALHRTQLVDTLMSVLDGIVLALVLYFGGRSVMTDAMTIGTLSSFVAVVVLVQRPASSVVSMLLEVARLPPSLDRLDDVLDTNREPVGPLRPPVLEGAIRFEHVSFRYGPKGPMLLDDVSFDVAPGERVAVVGRSGSGKSTIVKLVLGLLEPTSGRVLVDGRDVREYDPAALRRRLGCVSPIGALFDDSVLENVALGVAGADGEAVEHALVAAAVDEVVRELPGGVLANIGPRAHKLSGGQRQRLLLARALAKAPDVLLLDEASSALDAATEARVLSYIDALGCTMLFVGHRRSALRLASRLLFLERGRITASGRFDDLITSRFAAEVLGPT